MYEIALGPKDPKLDVVMVHSPGYHKMTIRPNDAAVCGTGRT